jgi:hypothetical protein
LISQHKNQNIEEAFNSTEGCKPRIATHWICNCGRDMYTRADKHIHDQRSKWKETELMINKAPKPFFFKSAQSIAIRDENLDRTRIVAAESEEMGFKTRVKN